MNVVVINGREYEVPEMDFNTVVELEEKGVSLLSLNEQEPKIATMLRAFTAWIMKTTPERAGKEIQEHLKHGGSLVDLIQALTKALDESGFSKGSAQKVTKLPQDHQKSQKNTRSKKTTSPSQT